MDGSLYTEYRCVTIDNCEINLVFHSFLLNWILACYSIYTSKMYIQLKFLFKHWLDFQVKNRRDMGYRRRMWLKISELATEIGNETGASGLSYSSTYFVGFILSAYAILINLASPGSSNVSIWGLVFPAAFSSTAYYLAVEAAHRATEQVCNCKMASLTSIALLIE